MKDTARRPIASISRGLCTENALEQNFSHDGFGLVEITLEQIAAKVIDTIEIKQYFLSLRREAIH